VGRSLLGTELSRKVLAGVIGLAGLFGLAQSASAIGGVYSLTLTSNADVFGGDPVLGPHEISVVPQGTEIVFTGDMSRGTAQELEEALNQHPAVDVVHLNSAGGYVTEGRQMFTLIHQRQLITVTDRYCTSACALAFLGGRERYLAPGARLGFHGEYSPHATDSEVAQFEQTDEKMMLDLGIPRDFVDKVFSTPSTELWIPSTQELETANVITGVSNYYALAAPPPSASSTAPLQTNKNDSSGAYQPPSVEDTPAGITIYRGSGSP
jgi:hypothetical protein